MDIEHIKFINAQQAKLVHLYSDDGRNRDRNMKILIISSFSILS